MKKYVTGLVVGKFLPLHHGHISVIAKASAECERVIVISYTSMVVPGMDASTREFWLKSYFGDSNVTVHVIPENLAPKDDADELVHRRFVANILLHQYGTTVQAVYGSEDYIEPFAKFLYYFFASNLNTVYPVDAVIVDKEREFYPCSGTMLRKAIGENDRYLMSTYLPDVVMMSVAKAKKILFVGAESTGKSTIAAKAAIHFQGQYVPEYGRKFYDKRKGQLKLEDMTHIAEYQYEIEKNYTYSSSLLFCDTSPLTTKFYCKEIFDFVPDKLKKLAEQSLNRYDHVFLCGKDIPFVQDGTRNDSATFREKMHEFFLYNLNPGFTVLIGSVEQRLKQIESVLLLSKSEVK